MELSPYEVALISGGFTVVGTLVGTWSGYRLTLSLSQTTAKRDAAAKFRTSFRDELLALNSHLSGNTIDACTLLEAAFSKHQAAVFEFKPFLGKDITRFEHAWKKYYQCDELPESQGTFLGKYSGKTCGSENAKIRRELAIQNIEHLLSFAQHK